VKLLATANKQRLEGIVSKLAMSGVARGEQRSVGDVQAAVSLTLADNRQTVDMPRCAIEAKAAHT